MMNIKFLTLLSSFRGLTTESKEIPRSSRGMTVVLLFILTFLVVYPAYAQNEPKFFDELYDVPVMEGLTVLTEQSMSFDKPDGRISQAVAFTQSVDWESIYLFYKETLTQMGWTMVEQGKFTREGEMLEISAEKNNSGLVIRFLLRPE